MSTSRRATTKAAAKRRADARRRTRVILRKVGALAIVGILVLGTVYAEIIEQIGVSGSTPASTSVPGVTIPTVNANFQTLLNQADQAVAAGQWISATSYYNAYLALSQDQSNPSVHFNLGKAMLNVPNPNYVGALAQLQQALSISPNGSFAPEAQSLIQQYNNKAQTAVALTQVVTGTVSLTSTVTNGGAVGGSPTTISATSAPAITPTAAPPVVAPQPATQPVP